MWGGLGVGGCSLGAGEGKELKAVTGELRMVIGYRKVKF